MPTEIAIESFWNLLQRSGVIHENNLGTLREEYEHDLAHLDGAKKVADDLVARELLTRWQADMILQGRHKGFFLGPYRLLDLLGKGGMGSVYLAEHQLMRRRSAVKVLPSKKINKPSMLERFTREAQAVAAMDHPNIVRAYEFNKELLDKTEVYYLAMEFVKGQDLQALVENKGVLDYVRAADFIRQAALGLAHSHESGLVHRDIKPANLLVDAKGVVKLLDLGLVKSFHNSAEASLTGEHENTVLGTADYLAPEQAVSSRDVDYRADIYSLGYTFYFSLTGHPPFPEGTIHQRMAAHQSRHAEPIIKDRSDVPDEMVAIINKMVAKRPVDRYQSAADVCQAISDWIFDHADDNWLLNHPEVINGDRSEQPDSPTERELTPASYITQDNTELDLLPLDDDERPKISNTKKPTDKQHSEPTIPKSDGTKASDAANENKRKKQQATNLTAGAASLPPLERDRIGTLLSSEPISPASQALRPIEPSPSLWTITGMSQRLQVPFALVVAALMLLTALVLGVGYLVFTSLNGHAPNSEASLHQPLSISNPTPFWSSIYRLGSAMNRILADFWL